MEKLLIQSFIYPSISVSGFTIFNALSDQYVFRPTGSTTAALIALLQSISDLLEIHPFVHVIPYHFSKAFDTVKHSTLMNKIASLSLRDPMYNWISWVGDTITQGTTLRRQGQPK